MPYALHACSAGVRIVSVAHKVLAVPHDPIAHRVADRGELYSWGGGMYGKLGHGNESGHSRPCLVESLKNVFLTQIACGSRHTIALSGALGCALRVVCARDV